MSINKIASFYECIKYKHHKGAMLNGHYSSLRIL